MSIQLKEEDHGRIFIFQVSGVLKKEEYDRVLPQVKALLRQQKTLRVLFQMTDFHGWEPSALWEELKFNRAEFFDLSSIDRCAMVGDRKWESIMATLSKPFTGAEIRYFDHKDLAGTRKWLDAALIHLPKAKLGRAAVCSLAVGACRFWCGGDRCACCGCIGNRAFTSARSSNREAVHRHTDGWPSIVLLCHGVPDVSYAWRHQVAALAAAGIWASDLNAGLWGYRWASGIDQHTVFPFVPSSIALAEISILSTLSADALSFMY